MSSLLKGIKSEKLKGIRKTFLWIAVCILIGELVVGAILILTGSWNDIIGRFMGMFALAAVALFVSINNFIRMEHDDKIVQSLALMSFVTNIIWLVLAVLMIWEIIPFYWQEEITQSGYYSSYVTTTSHLTVTAKIMWVAVSLAAAGFWISNVLAIKETVKPVKPLKITAAICEAYCSLYSIIVIVFLADQMELLDDLGRWTALSGLAELAFVVTALAAWIISRSNRKKEESVVNMQNKAEIQAQVQEMVEKEVQMRLEQERVKTEGTEPERVEEETVVVEQDTVKVEEDTKQNEQDVVKVEQNPEQNTEHSPEQDQ